MQIETRLSNELSRYLDLATSEVKLTAANMANVDTPGYKTIGMDFDAEMKNALDASNKETTLGAVSVKPVDGLITRPDGNNVSMDRESLNLAEAQLRYKTGITLLKREYQNVMDAIHADK
jgi:flagellar basal-body rod protein FlgB